MANINTMTAPLKKYEHGGFHTEPVRKKMEEKVWAGENRLRDIGGTVLDKLKGLVRPVEAGDDPIYMKLFNRLWEEGYGVDQIEDIINGKVNKDDIVPSEKLKAIERGDEYTPSEFRGARGGLASISQMTRPVHMAGGGDASLKDLLGQLRIQLMLEKGIEGSILMPSGNPDKIKRLEERIRQIEIEIGE